MQRACVLAVFAMLGALAVFVPGHASTQQPAAASPERARLLERERAAGGHLRQAARTGAQFDGLRPAPPDASGDLDALGADTPLLTPSLRTELRKAAVDLTALA